jgi:hypothetical protein
MCKYDRKFLSVFAEFVWPTRNVIPSPNVLLKNSCVGLFRLKIQELIPRNKVSSESFPQSALAFQK